MLQTLQIVALLQGFLVLAVLFFNRNDYKKTTFWLLFGSLLSVLLYIAGDDENNILVKDADWFLFDSSLFITFLFLFVKYYTSGKERFKRSDLIYFLPNVIYFFIEAAEVIMQGEPWFIEVLEISVELSFLAYLIIIIGLIFNKHKTSWIIYITVPIAILFSIASILEILRFFDFEVLSVFNEQYFNTYLLLIIAFLFYFLAFKLLNKGKEILPKVAINKYQNSNLTEQFIEQYKADLIHAMEVDKLYRNGKLSIQDVSSKLNIPRQYISEVLNEHMDISFQDFVNKYRVDEFVHRLQNDQNKHFTLLGIATKVGFNSKSSFNATFKKIKGLTPSEYKKSLG